MEINEQHRILMWRIWSQEV